jgi:hypothetical protein
MTYLLRQWKGLAAFLLQAGAPLDTNVCERALNRAVLHRKNALFYRTLHVTVPKPAICSGVQPIGMDDLELLWDAGAGWIIINPKWPESMVFGAAA